MATRRPKKTRNASARRKARLEQLTSRAKKVQKDNRIRARGLVADIRKRLERIQEDFHAIGRLLTRLRNQKLYTALGYDSFEALLAGEKLMSVTTAYRMMRVATAFDARSAKSLGLQKAYALHAYTEATPIDDIAKILAAGDARVGKSKTPVSEISVRELRAETRRQLRTTGKRKPSDEEKKARAAARAVQRALRKRGATDARAEAKRIDGRWRVLIDVDPAHADVIAG